MTKCVHTFESVDVRVRMLVMLLVSLSALMLKTEQALLFCLIFMWIWLIPFGCVGKAVRCTLAYGVLYGLLFLMKNSDLFGNLPLLAAAIMWERPILILDEPTSGLDGRHMREMSVLLRHIADKDTCILMITHDTELIAQCADRIFSLSNVNAPV